MNDRIVHRHRADHGGAFPAKFLPERLGVAMAGQVHDGFRPHVHSAHYLFHFNIVILAVPADAQIYIDFCFKHAADTVGVKTFMQRVGRNHEGTVCHPLPDKLHGPVFLSSYLFHLRRDNVISRRFHLCVILFSHALLLSAKSSGSRFTFSLQFLKKTTGSILIGHCLQFLFATFT